MGEERVTLLTYNMIRSELELAVQIVNTQMLSDMHCQRLTFKMYDEYIKELEVYWGALDIVKQRGKRE
jgi:hypothetical protein